MKTSRVPPEGLINDAVLFEVSCPHLHRTSKDFILGHAAASYMEFIMLARNKLWVLKQNLNARYHRVYCIQLATNDDRSETTPKQLFCLVFLGPWVATNIMPLHHSLVFELPHFQLPFQDPHSYVHICQTQHFPTRTNFQLLPSPFLLQKLKFGAIIQT